MSELSVTYDNTRAVKRKPFNIDDITETLMSEPINLDLNNIAHTPVAVIVNLPKEEYMKRRIGTIILRKYDAITICKDEMLIFKSENEE